MGEEFRRELERVVEKMKSELDALVRRVDEMVGEGDVRGAYRAWAEGVVGILREVRESLKRLESYTRELRVPESELKESLEYLRREIGEVLSKIEAESSRLRGRWGRGLVFYLPDFTGVVEGVVAGVGKSVEDAVESIGRLIESVQRSVARSYDRLAQVVSLRMREGDLEVIDRLVEAGIFRSRSEAVAYFARRGIESSREWISRALEQAKKIREMQESLRRELEEREEE